MAEDLYSSPPSHFVQENVSLHKQLPSYSYSPTVPTVEGKRSPWVQERDAKGHVLYFNTLTGERHPAEPTDWLLKEFHQGYELYVNSYTNDYFWKHSNFLCTVVPSRESKKHLDTIPLTQKKKRNGGKGNNLRPLEQEQQHVLHAILILRSADAHFASPVSRTLAAVRMQTMSEEI
eukprot:gb/GECG01003720.1/.p1 GENE.gb/GECG01003720.1/~~gb/GECG01003720.1/.p1  ORF type:complete len:176 (+),score=14.02 gb/GECG01003720.1/:1-528(+)